MFILKTEHVGKIYGLGPDKFGLINILFNKTKLHKRDNVVALDNINFELNRGEAFGIIGRNGSGKSTLLQIIAGTLKPTSGTITVNGRVSALLELGSGFNPEFTGIENIYLSVSILVISREQMQGKLSEVETFADIGDFINQPVRTYSSGMLMRVAFAVAVAVEPDLLIIDEALSVGDILFQQKCNVRLKQLLSKGVSLLVVTHDTSFVLNMCQRALWLNKGEPLFLGSASECVQRYLSAMANEAGNADVHYHEDIEISKLIEPESVPLDLTYCKVLGDDDIYISKAWILNSAHKSSNTYQVGQWCMIYLKVNAKIDLELVSAGCELRDRHGQVIFATGLRVIGKLIPNLNSKESRLVKISFQLNIAPGQYTLDIGCGAGEGQYNKGSRVIYASIIDVISKPDDDIVHGLVKLPYQIEVS